MIWWKSGFILLIAVEYCLNYVYNSFSVPFQKMAHCLFATGMNSTMTLSHVFHSHCYLFFPDSLFLIKILFCFFEIYWSIFIRRAYIQTFEAKRAYNNIMVVTSYSTFRILRQIAWLSIVIVHYRLIPKHCGWKSIEIVRSSNL